MQLEIQTVKGQETPVGPQTRRYYQLLTGSGLPVQNRQNPLRQVLAVRPRREADRLPPGRL